MDITERSKRPNPAILRFAWRLRYNRSTIIALHDLVGQTGNRISIEDILIEIARSTVMVVRVFNISSICFFRHSF